MQTQYSFSNIQQKKLFLHRLICIPDGNAYAIKVTQFKTKHAHHIIGNDWSYIPRV